MEEHSSMDTNKKRDEVLLLFLKNQDMVAGFLYTLVHDWDIVEESIQETTLYLCNHWDDYEPGTNFGAWIRTVARMRCRNIVRLKQRLGKLLRKDFESISELLTYDEWDKTDDTRPQRAQHLDQCIRSLPAEGRKALEMLYQDKLPYQKIAEQLNKSVDALYMVLSRSRKRLKICMERRLAKDLA